MRLGVDVLVGARVCVTVGVFDIKGVRVIVAVIVAVWVGVGVTVGEETGVAVSSAARG